MVRGLVIGLLARGLEGSGLVRSRRGHHGRARIGALLPDRGCAVRWTLRLHNAGAQVAPRAGPWCERRREGVRESVGGAFVVDAPPSKMRPRLLGAALHGEPDQRQLVNGA